MSKHGFTDLPASIFYWNSFTLLVDKQRKLTLGKGKHSVESWGRTHRTWMNRRCSGHNSVYLSSLLRVYGGARESRPTRIWENLCNKLSDIPLIDETEFDSTTELTVVVADPFPFDCSEDCCEIIGQGLPFKFSIIPRTDNADFGIKMSLLVCF